MLVSLRGSLLLLPLCCGCPSVVSDSPPVENESSEEERLASDPRVVKSGNSFYAKDSLRDLQGPDESRGLGSGVPDETNGRCRLYAPELPEPECCRAEYGLDAEQVRKACGLGAYLGESFHMTCGYYFHRNEDIPAWFRLSFLPGSTPREAVASHDRQVGRLANNPDFRSQPIPGISGAYWSSHDGLNWAFLPGWSRVRQFTWPDHACNQKDVMAVLRHLVRAKEPPADAPRTSLTPVARQ